MAAVQGAGALAGAGAAVPCTLAQGLRMERFQAAPLRRSSDSALKRRSVYRFHGDGGIRLCGLGRNATGVGLCSHLVRCFIMCRVHGPRFTQQACAWLFPVLC